MATDAATSTKTASGDSALSPAPAFAPKQRIAQLTVSWLEVDAISLNGRQYTQEAFDALVRNAQLDLANPDEDPLTCYVSHGEAESDNSRELVGRITRIWTEGLKAFATIDIPDTQAGRDVGALVATGYLKPVSLRAIEAQVRMVKGRAIPQVCGNPRLRGIDFTTTPGIAKIARTRQVILESEAVSSPQSLTEVFSEPEGAIHEEAPPMDTLQEEHVPTLASGDSSSVTADPTTGDYAKRVLSAPEVLAPLIPPQMTPAAGQSDSLQTAHDHAAAALGLPCAPSGMQEAGRALNKKNRTHLAAIHNAASTALGMTCEAYDPDHDGDDDATSDPIRNPDAAQDAAQGMQFSDDDDMEDEMEKQELTPEQAIAFLREKGYSSLETPKTAEQVMQEKFDALQASFDTKLAALTEALTKAAPVQAAAATTATATQSVQRQSLVEGATTTGQAATTRVRPPNMYQSGQYLREKVKDIDWAAVADRSCPLPEGVTAGRLLKEVAGVMLANALVSQG